MTNHVLSIPEFLAERPDVGSGPWTVMSGYGYPFSDITARVIRSPDGKSKWSEVIRARELIRSQFSPPDMAAAAAAVWYPPEVVWACEEIRINALTTKAGYNLSELQDGGEEFHSQRVVEDGSWEEAVMFVCCLTYSSRCGDFISAMPDNWRKPLETLISAVNAAKTTGLNVIATKKRSKTDLPRGFLAGVELFGPIVMRCLDAESFSMFENKSLFGVKKPTLSAFMNAVPFASMSLERLPMRAAGGGSFGKSNAATNAGRAVRRPERLVTDPQKKIFGSEASSTGGIVVIDLSTSLSVSTVDLDAILGAAPGAVVIGYSHDPSWCSPVPKLPNAWVLAENGQRCDTVPLSDMPIGHGGNGVDGPVLEYASSIQMPGDPIIWITDGVVSNYRDEVSRVCALECLALVQEHSIYVAESISDGVQLLGSLAAGRRPNQVVPQALIDMANGTF